MTHIERDPRLMSPEDYLAWSLKTIRSKTAAFEKQLLPAGSSRIKAAVNRFAVASYEAGITEGLSLNRPKDDCLVDAEVHRN